MEGATGHPLQSLADAITMEEFKTDHRPRHQCTLNWKTCLSLHLLKSDKIFNLKKENWSSYKDYGKITNNDTKWTVTADKMKLTNHAKFMHCLPVRRNVVVTDEVTVRTH
jgi:N-succinyl-L-ornithine transcarbamylase